MIHNYITNRTFFVKYGQDTGTAFAADVNGKQYLISANHVFPNAPNHFQIEILQDNAWKILDVQIVGRPEKADVIVLAPSTQIAAKIPEKYAVGLASVNLTFGQDVYFLGFPYGIFTDVENSAHPNALPFPFVKKAIISARAGTSEEGIWLLDGINNPGFSGGPVIAKDIRGAQKMQDPFSFIGIISAYKTSQDQVSDGRQELPIFALGNSGIIISYDAKIAADLIAKNPIGCEVIM